MKNTSAISIDLSKQVFQFYGINHAGKCVLNRSFRREEVREQLMKLPSGCPVYMEACSSAHYWSREIEELGQKPRQIPSQYVKPFVSVHKSDKRDAQGILDAGQRPGMRFVATKSKQQQEQQIMIRIRQRLVKEKTAVSNEIRGFLAEFGIVLKKSFKALWEYLNYELERDNSISERLKKIIRDLKEDFKTKEKRLAEIDKEIRKSTNESEQAKNLLKMQGIGIITASVLCCNSGNMNEFENGRNFAASVGLVPRQHGTGGKTKLLGITKSGNSYLRSLLIMGAQSVINNCHKKTDNFSLWVQKLLTKKHRNLVAIAIANKNARIAWRVLAKGDIYDPNLACQSL